MKNWHFLLVGLLIALAAIGSAEARTDSTWQAQYFNNIQLSGNAVVWRNEPSLVHYWGEGSPDNRISSDRFSARWTRRVDLEAGTYRFTAKSDDGVRVFVNGQRILDKWQFQSATHSADFNVGAGEALIVVEYFENTGSAHIDFSFDRVRNSPGEGGSGGDGFEGRWRGEYYNNRYLSGSPALIRASNVIDFDWGNGSPDGVIQADNFSVRWTQNVATNGGRYRFTTTSDDGVRVFVNGQPLIDKWFDQRATQYSAEINLPNGNSFIEVQYYEHSAQAVMQLRIERVGQPAQPSSTITVDNSSPNFTAYGPANRLFSTQAGFGGSLLWGYTLSSYTNDQNYAYWTPSLAEQRYEVQVYVPQSSASTVNAQYWVQHKFGRLMVPVNQSTNNGKWVSLGSFDFAGNGSDNVALSTITYESSTRQIAFDAIRWIPVR